MQNGIFFSMISLVYCCFIGISFLLKKKIKTKENAIYGILLFYTIFGLNLEIFIALRLAYGLFSFVNELAVIILNRLLIIYMISWLIVLTYYVIYISIKDEIIISVSKIIAILLFILSVILSIILPIEIYSFDKIAYSAGLITTMAYAFCGFLELICSIAFIIGLVKYKIKISKYYPVILFFILGFVSMLIQHAIPELTIMLSVHSIVVYVMFQTIENPDVKMAKELAFQKELQEASSKKTIELIEDMSSDLKSSINKLEAFGNKKIDKSNVDELSKEFEEFQSESIGLSDKISSVLDLAMIKGETETKECKYETYDMLDKLNQLLKVEQENNTKLDIDISKSFPSVLYGDKDNVIRVVIYFYNLLSSIKKDKLSLKIDSLNVGRFLRLRFKFNVGDTSISDYVYKNDDTKELVFRKENDLNFQIVQKILKKYNGKIVVSEESNNQIITLSINQRLMTEYEIISNREENKNVKIKYKDFSGKRVLIVDDNKVKVKELKILLKPYKLDVYDVTSPIEVSNILNNNVTFDLVIIDDIISNYKLDEFTNEIIKPKDDFLKKIDVANYPISTVIMVTPNSNDMENKYLKIGFDNYITKPINKENLDKVLMKVLNKK